MMSEQKTKVGSATREATALKKPSKSLGKMIVKFDDFLAITDAMLETQNGIKKKRKTTNRFDGLSQVFRGVLSIALAFRQIPVKQHI